MRHPPWYNISNMTLQPEEITFSEVPEKRRHSRLRTGIQKSWMMGRKTGEQKMQFIGCDAATTTTGLPRWNSGDTLVCLRGDAEVSPKRPRAMAKRPRIPGDNMVRLYLPDLRLDAGHCVAERNEANNTTYQGNVVRDCQNIHVHIPRPNLTVWRGVGANYAPHPSDITLNGLSDNGQPVNGVTMPLMAIVTNNGEATATNVRTVLRRQPFNENIGFGTPYGFSLKGGQTQTVIFNDWTPESGNYHLEAEVDFQDLVDEINENDNVATREIPELEVVDVNAKKSGE